MQEEQQKANSDTPKIVALLVLVLIVLGVGAWNFMHVSSAANGAPAPAVAAGTTPGTTVAPASVASAAGPGEIREANPLDEDGPHGRVPLGVFNVPKVPVVVADNNNPPPFPRGRNPQPIQGPIGQPPGPTSLPSIQGGVAVPTTHPDTIRVEGVVTGPDGFAMITYSNQTLFKRPGQTLMGYTITRLSENGVIARHPVEVWGGKTWHTTSEPVQWPIGEGVTVMAPGPPPAGAAGAPPSTNVGPAPVSGLPPMQAPDHTLPPGVRSYTSGKTQLFMPTERY